MVRLIVRGRTTREISAGIFVSEHTVQRHIQNAFEKVGVGNRGELVKRLCFENPLPGMLGGSTRTPRGASRIESAPK
jgi:hypothetical protein